MLVFKTRTQSGILLYVELPEHKRGISVGVRMDWNAV
jgi:uncharacterized membrane protein